MMGYQVYPMSPRRDDNINGLDDLVHALFDDPGTTLVLIVLMVGGLVGVALLCKWLFL